MALGQTGTATTLREYRAELEGEGREADAVAYLRAERGYRNLSPLSRSRSARLRRGVLARRYLGWPGRPSRKWRIMCIMPATGHPPWPRRDGQRGPDEVVHRFTGELFENTQAERVHVTDGVLPVRA